MQFKTIEDLKEAGFSGFVPVKDLQTSEQRKIIPSERGVYMILRTATSYPEFLPQMPIRELKSYDVVDLQKNWDVVTGTIVIYIGKAGNLTGKASLRSRLRQYVLRKKNHSGGRSIWQLAYSDDLLVCWKPTPEQNPRDVERELIKSFEMQYGAKPFANRSS